MALLSKTRACLCGGRPFVPATISELPAASSGCSPGFQAVSDTVVTQNDCYFGDRSAGASRSSSCQRAGHHIVTARHSGRLYGTEDERLTMLALLPENVGADKAARLGNSSIWRGAIGALSEVHEDPETEAPVSRLPEAERHVLEAALSANAHAQHEALRAHLDPSSDHWGFEDRCLPFSIIRASKYSGFSSRPTPSFRDSVAFSQTVRCIHGSFRSFAKERAKSSRLLTAIAGLSSRDRSSRRSFTRDFSRDGRSLCRARCPSKAIASSYAALHYLYQLR
jgi:hypothetical protein